MPIVNNTANQKSAIYGFRYYIRMAMNTTCGYMATHGIHN